MQPPPLALRAGRGGIDRHQLQRKVEGGEGVAEGVAAEDLRSLSEVGRDVGQVQHVVVVSVPDKDCAHP